MNASFGPDRSIELVLDLQQVGVQLLILTTLLHADLLVVRIRPGERLLHRGRVFVQAVVGDVQAALGVRLVTEPSHAQRRAPGKIERPFVQHLQPMLLALHEALADGGGGAEQIDQQPGVAPEVADQPEVLIRLEVLTRFGPPGPRERGPEGLRQGEVVVDAGDGLHQPAIAMAEPQTIDGLGHGDVRGAVAPHGNILIGTQNTGHAGGPEQFVVQVLIDKAVHVTEFSDGAFRSVMDAGDELELSLGEIGGDVGMCQRGTQGSGMLTARELAVRPDPQTFLLDAAAQALQQPGLVAEKLRQGESFSHRQSPCTQNA